MPAPNGHQTTGRELSPAFICGHPRGGTTLLTTLLDSHPELVVLPGESQYFQKYFLRRKFSKIVLTASNRTNIRWMKSSLVKWPFTHMSSISPQEIRPILKQWASYFPDAESPNDVIDGILSGRVRRANYWDCYLQMYAAMTGVDLKSKRCWLEKTPSNEKFVPLNDALFGNTVRYMHVLRDPRSVVSSLLTYDQKGLSRRDHILNLCRSWSKSVHDGMQNKRACGERYLLLKYEDLVTSTEDMMHQVQDFLGIERDVAVLSPSRIGQEYRMNSAYSEDRAQASGVVTTQIDRFTSKLSRDEIGYIESLVGPIMEQIGYNRDESSEGPSAEEASTRARLRTLLIQGELNRVKHAFERKDYSGFIAQPAYSPEFAK